jgi:hypothetical protein
MVQALQVWVMSLPGGTHQMELRVDLTPGMTAYDLVEAARRAWGALSSSLSLQSMLLAQCSSAPA